MNRPRPLAASPWLRALFALTFTLSVALAGFAPGAVLVRAAGTASLASLGVAVTEDFNSLVSANTGTSTNTPAGWDFIETGTNANLSYTAGTGSGTAGDTYSFGTTGSADRAFGGLLSGSLVPTIGASFVNNTGETITSLAVSYTGEQWRLGTIGRTDRLDFQYSTSATALNTGTWLDVDALDVVAPITAGTTGALDGNAAANRVAVSGTISGLVIAPGATFFIRWSDFNASNADDGLGIDDFSITPFSSPVTPTPETPTATPETPTPVTPTPETPTATPDVCTGSATPIPAVQGSGDVTPFNGQAVTVRGVVAADFQGAAGLNGFNLQDLAGDSNPATSDGIFVFVPSANSAWFSFDVAVGDVVTLTGRATEFQGLTEIDTVTAITKCGTASAPTPVSVTLPETVDGELERYEGMLVSISGPLTAQQNFFQGRFGQVTLGVGRLFQPTNSFDAGSPQALAAANLNARSLIVLDDGRSAQNPNPIPYIGQDNTLRAGDTVSGVVGVLDFGPINSNTAIRDYRIHPTEPVSFTRVNQRTAAPDPVGGNVQVASFNVLNYFNGDGQGGGFPTSRGATTEAEFNRQRTKIIAALSAIDADVVGLMEIENDAAGSLSAIQDLVNGLNAATAPGTYAVVATPAPGSDEIKVALIYKPGVVTPVGAAQNYQVSDPTYGAGLFDRPPLGQTFSLNATGARFTVVVNHFKSKGSCPTSGVDTDQGDGQSCWNPKRVRQAQELLGFIGQLQAASGDQDVLVIGDLNAYGSEDPIQVLTTAGMVNQLAARLTNPYSYVFDGLAGYLDHALTTASLDGQVSGVTEWHINADEPSVIDYNTEFKPQDLYAPNAYKASDHDPVIVGLNLVAPSTPTPETPTATTTTPTAETPTVSPTTPTATPVSADVVISQVYGGGGNSGAVYTNDFIELYNRGSAPVSLSDWSVQYASAAGTSWSVTNLSGTIQPGGYYLIQQAAGAGGTMPLPAPNATGSIAMSGTSGKVALVSATAALSGACPSANVVDFVGYGSVNCSEGNAAPGLSNTTAALRKNGGATDTNNNSADFVTGAPNPRNSAGGTPTITPTTATPTPTTPTATPETPTPTTPTATPDPCQASFTPIFTIQGSGASAAVTGSVTTRGVVVGDFEGPTSAGLQGFYLQDPSGDGNPATSDGIFVFNSNTNSVSVGDLVVVSGSAAEFSGQTQISSVTSLRICGSGSLAPADVELPFASADFLERYEGMLVRFPQALQITEYFNYDRFGEVALGLPLPGEPRIFSPTVLDEPGAAAQARAAANALRRITLDDGLGAQNPNVTRHPNGEPFSLTNRFRGGDEVRNAVGVLGYSFNLYRIQPTGPAEYIPQNPRPAEPESVGGRLKVSAFNTLNYFLTLDTIPGSNNGPNICGPQLSQECRGANNATELTRQRDKLLAAIVGLDADVLGLNELENSAGVEPLADIVAGLNQQLGAGSYAYINTGTIGTDAIKVGLIYQPAKVTPIGGFQLLTTAVDPRFLDTKNRPVLAQTFEEIGTGARFTVAVAHLKSKGSDCNDVGDLDVGDGAGNCNGTRTDAAEALVDWLASDPTDSGDTDFLIVGDLNSYAQEDPIDAILAGPDGAAGNADDYANLILEYQGEYAYSYVFDGQVGYLDHALASPSLAAQVTGATEWHINADEPDLLDYDTSFKSNGQDALYEPNAYRTSDHDPVQVGLALNRAPVAQNLSGATNEDRTAGITLPASDPDGDPLTYSIVSGPANGTLSGTAPDLAYTPNPNFNGVDSFTFRVSDGEFTSNIATVTITVIPVNDAPLAQNDTASTTRGTAVVINVLGNDTDIDGDSLTIISVSKPANGQTRIVNGQIRYGPKENFTGTDTFTYTISDGKGGTATATVTITVTRR